MKVIDTERIPIKMWLNDIEDSAMAQARDLANLPFAFKWIAIMPDSHCGYGMPIGGVMATPDVIIPNAVGVDIGCGMIAVRTSALTLDIPTIKEIMGETRKVVPVGFNHQEHPQAWEGWDIAPDIKIIQQELTSAKKQLGTLGGGNHFIEIQSGDDGHIWLMIHSGSRNFGLKTANDYHKKAVALCERWESNIPCKDLSFLPMTTPEGKEYFEAMNYCLAFAQANRALMMSNLLSVFKKYAGGDKELEINIHHNYAAFENHFGKDVLIHRKGAVKAREGMDGIIPGSMGSKSYIVKGLGNPDSFMSSSHGAGRRMGRGEATKKLNLEDEQAKMGSIVHGLRTAKDLDEAPGAYKDIDEVMANQADLVSIAVTLTPLAGIKG
jgi:tRNA-splicing ligase RtcB